MCPDERNRFRGSSPSAIGVGCGAERDERADAGDRDRAGRAARLWLHGERLAGCATGNGPTALEPMMGLIDTAMMARATAPPIRAAATARTYWAGGTRIRQPTTAARRRPALRPAAGRPEARLAAAPASAELRDRYARSVRRRRQPYPAVTHQPPALTTGGPMNGVRSGGHRWFLPPMRKMSVSSGEEPAARHPLCLSRGSSSRFAQRPLMRGSRARAGARAC